ncbi:uncharacterized protein At4g26450-like isoform X2 [Amaranthus tricolor]|uniref:uncharacterized protein At4g26450-like isoform X2 n=1 Tax=Amaranthus tricolor TaxID=29722 RepID=UPI00258D8B13|nr:uncharacterized protein At4g26450-like isoform X2 [Amaranthus tricolor]
MRYNMSGIGFNNAEPRNFNRGFGRGIPKPFPPLQRRQSPQTPRKGDLFLEAGRLAVDYLVSRGLLSSNVLPGKNQDGSLRNNSGESHDLRSSQDRDGSVRSPIDQDSSMARNYSRERRRLEHTRSFSSDRSYENEREGSLAEETTRSTTPVAVENDVFHKDTPKSTDTSVESSHPSELVAKNDRHNELPDEIGKDCSLSDPDSKKTTLVENDNDKEVVSASDVGNAMFEETKDGTDNRNEEQDNTEDNLAIQKVVEKSDNSPSMGSSPNSDLVLTNQENNVSEPGLDFQDSCKHDPINVSVETPSSTNCIGSIVSDLSFREIGELNPAYPVDQQKSLEVLSFSCEQNSSGLTELGMCSSICQDRGEKRPIEEDNVLKGAKKAKHQQWLTVAHSDEYSLLSDLSDKHSSQSSFTNVSLPLKVDVESNINGERQMLSNSFKICDLNLMEGSNLHESHNVTTLLYPSTSGPCRDMPVDIHLSITNSRNLTHEYNESGSVRKDIDIIDLESTSLEECKRSNDSMKNSEAGITSMESFQNPQNSTENPDGQDGYGFMISELLGNDVPNCSSVQPDMNPLHNDIGLNHGEEMFSEDDPIYMSLGEIPLSLLRAWEQPTQERNPFEL